MPATEAELFAYLLALGIPTTTVRHPPVFTVAEAKHLRGAVAGAHTKNLLLTDKKGGLWLIVAEEDRPIALNALHRRLGFGRLSFAGAETLKAALGVEPGSVTPFAAINDRRGQVAVVLDAGLLGAARINVHPLANTATTAIRPDDLLAFFNACGHPPRILDLESGSGT
jgi:Ala-tRNA(Pro) deacylase